MHVCRCKAARVLFPCWRGGAALAQTLKQCLSRGPSALKLGPLPPRSRSPFGLAGKVFTAQSTDKGVTWSKPAPTSLPNPNSKVSTVTIDGQVRGRALCCVRTR